MSLRREPPAGQPTPASLPAWLSQRPPDSAPLPKPDIAALPPPSNRRAALISLLRLAAWQFRPAWRLWLLALLGLTLAVALVGVSPLYNQLTATAGLRQALSLDSSTSQLTASFNSTSLSPTLAATYASGVDQLVRQQIAPYLAGPPQVSTLVSNLSITTYNSDGTLSDTPDSMFVRGLDISAIAPRVQLVAGAFPAAQSADLQIVMLKEAAAQLGVKVGDKVPLLFFASGSLPKRIQPTDALFVPVTIVGLIEQPDLSDPFWQINTLSTLIGDNGGGNTYRVIASQATLNTVMGKLGATKLQNGSYPVFPVTLTWLYRIDPQQFRADQLGAAITQFDNLQVEFSSQLALPDAYRFQISSPLFDPNSLLSDYNARLTVTQTPVLAMQAGIILVVLFFVALLTDVQIDQQADAIATLRSRGVSRWQLFFALALQSLVLAGIALAGGLALAVPATVGIAQLQLPASVLSSTNVITAHIGQSISGIVGYGVVAVLVALAALVVAAAVAARADVLTLRREAARTTRATAWQRLNLDIVAAAGAVLAFLLSLYLQFNVAGIDPQIDRLLAPVFLVAPLFLMAAVLLIFLRLFLVLLRGATTLALRSRGAVPTLAVAQLARAPRQALRLALLLVVALSFAVFITSLGASQDHYDADIAAFQTGADFSGTLSFINTANHYNLADYQAKAAKFQAIPGVTGVSLGYTEQELPTSAILGGIINVFAVDAATYASVAVWPSTDTGAQQLPTALSEMVQLRNQPTLPIPAIVDQKVWDDFHLTLGTTFSLEGNGGNIAYQAIARVRTIPGTPLDGRGILVDYPTFSLTTTPIGTQLSPINAVWLRTRSDPATLNAVRLALATGELRVNNLNDRRATLANLLDDPLAQTLRGLVTVAFVVPLALALAAALVASVVQVRRRLVSFAVLRALGARPAQITGVLLLEQTITYSIALVLGVGLGWLLSLLQVPNLLYANAAQTQGASITSASFYALQELLPVQVVPSAVALIALGALVVLGAVALALMTRAVSRPSVSQTLRLNED